MPTLSDSIESCESGPSTLVSPSAATDYAVPRQTTWITGLANPPEPAGGGHGSSTSASWNHCSLGFRMLSDDQLEAWDIVLGDNKFENSRRTATTDRHPFPSSAPKPSASL